MRKTAVSSTLVVRFDGQFWVGIVERVEDGALSSCRVVFGAEPSSEEVLDFVLREWVRLPLGPAVAFMLSGPATKLTNLGALKTVLGARSFALYIAFAMTFAVAAGYAAAFLQ